MIGTDIYLIITVVAVISNWLYLQEILRYLREVGVVLCIFLVGLYASFFTARGFINASNLENTKKIKLYSCIMLGVAGLGLIAAFHFKGNYRFSITLPLLAIGMTNRFLIKKMAEKE